MRGNSFFIVLSICFSLYLLPWLLAGEINAQPARLYKQEISPAKKREATWKRIEPLFAPPAEFRNDFGDYRSPLIFSDGRKVRNERQWKVRREEIRNRWEELLGPWPALLTEQQLEFLDTTRRESFTQYRVRFFWTPSEKTEGYLLVPDGDGTPRPAVITVYYEPETAIGEGVEKRDFAYQLTKRGFVTLSLGTTEATRAKTYSLYYPGMDSVQTEPLSMLACAAANAWYALANTPGVDSARIGIMGHSFGGKWAMFASCMFDKFAAAVWSDPGIVFDNSRSNINYWEPWYLGFHPKPWRTRGLITERNPAFGTYPKMLARGMDLHELHALMAPRPFLVSGGEEDPPRRWVPLNHTIAVNRILGVEDRVAMTNRSAHAPNDESNEMACLFFEHFLKD